MHGVVRGCLERDGVGKCEADTYKKFMEKTTGKNTQLIVGPGLTCTCVTDDCNKQLWHQIMENAQHVQQMNTTLYTRINTTSYHLMNTKTPVPFTHGSNLVETPKNKTVNRATGIHFGSLLEVIWCLNIYLLATCCTHI